MRRSPAVWSSSGSGRAAASRNCTRIILATGHIRSARANWLAARTLCVNYFGEGVVHLIAGDDHVGLVFLPELSFELAPFLLGPSKLLGRRGKVQEVHRNDVGPGPQ